MIKKGVIFWNLEVIIDKTRNFSALDLHKDKTLLHVLICHAHNKLKERL